MVEFEKFLVDGWGGQEMVLGQQWGGGQVHNRLRAGFNFAVEHEPNRITKSSIVK